MRKIGQYEFPETPEEAVIWAPSFATTALHSKVLLVAKTRIEGCWRAYCVPVPGRNHNNEWLLWEANGTALQKSIALAAFPQFAEIPYAT